MPAAAGEGRPLHPARQGPRRSVRGDRSRAWPSSRQAGHARAPPISKTPLVGVGTACGTSSRSPCPRTAERRATSSVIASWRSAARHCREACTCHRIRGTTRCDMKPSASASRITSRWRRPTTSRSAACRDPRQLARTLWPLDEVAAAYERFIDQHRHVPEQLEEMRRRKERFSDDHFLPFAFAMAVAMSECTRNDPFLPPELLPRPWPGRSARDLVLRSRRLALLVREEHDRPALLHLYDLMVEALS